MQSKFITRLKKDGDATPDKIREAFGVKDYDKCFPLCEEFLKKHPKNVIIRLYKGTILHELEKTEEALIAFNIILEELPEFWYVWRCAGRCYMDLGEYQKARDSYMKSLKIGGAIGGNVEDICAIAISYAKEDQYDAAHYILDHGYEHASSKTLILFTRGLLQEKVGNIDGAFFSYLQSQVVADGEDKDIGAEKIGKLLKK